MILIESEKIAVRWCDVAWVAEVRTAQAEEARAIPSGVISLRSDRWLSVCDDSARFGSELEKISVR